jgi:hypothetical protein
MVDLLGADYNASRFTGHGPNDYQASNEVSGPSKSRCAFAEIGFSPANQRAGAQYGGTPRWGQ